MAARSGWRRLAVLPFAFLGACYSPPSVRFAPAVQEAELRGEANDLQGRIVVAWRGFEPHDDPHEMAFRVRVENPGTTPFTLVPAEFQLLDAALTPFEAPDTERVPVAVDPGAAATFDLVFPFPPGRRLENLDLSALNLHLRFQAGRWNWSTTLQRVERVVVRDPYYPPVSFSVGVGWVF